MERKLDTTSFTPLYHQLKEIITEKIESNEWPSGTKIPSETEMQKNYNISRNTAIKAFEELVQEGKLNRVRGKGTFVSTPKIEQSLSRFYSFSKVIRSQGLEPKDIILNLEITKVKQSIAKILNVDKDQEVIKLNRLRCAQDEPIILETSYIPISIMPGLKKEDLENKSLYDVMQEKYGVYVVRANEVFEPVLIRDHESELLKVGEGYPALLLDRIAYDKNGVTVEFCRSIIRGDRCRFYTELF